MVLTYKEKFNKKFNFDKDKSHSLEEIAKISDYQLKHLKMIFNKGLEAFKTNRESMPEIQSPEQSAYGRVYSAVMGGPASKIDKDHLIKKTKKIYQ